MENQSYAGVNGVLGWQVRKLRKAAGLSQDAVAARCGIYRTYLSRIENGTANPSLSVVAALAVTLNVKISTLIDEDEVPD